MLQIVLMALIKDDLSAFNQENYARYFVMIDTWDSKELYYDVFKKFFAYSDKLRNLGMEARDEKPAHKPLKVTHSQDRNSAQMVCLNEGRRIFLSACQLSS